jgi:hypothetical protein
VRELGYAIALFDDVRPSDAAELDVTGRGRSRVAAARLADALRGF